MGILRLHRTKLSLFLGLVLLELLPLIVQAESKVPEKSKSDQHSKISKSTSRTRTVCRLFFQDRATQQVKWADVRKGKTLTLETPAVIDGFPDLDTESQNLVQMEQSLGTLMVGVRDQEAGQDQSGWVFFDSGVKEESHGNHSHWYYKKQPKVIGTRLDTAQGNPAHLYCYQGVFYLANDRNSGYTRLDPQWYRDDPKANIKTGFHRGGGNHITLAVAAEKTGYSTWIDGGGPQKGMVDVTRILPDGNEQIAYSFALPTGAIHGATVCEGKVFFAPADGICWCEADLNPLPGSQSKVKVQHLSLGEDPETKKPGRTGAFTTQRNYVLFVSGTGDTARLCLLNASLDEPALISVPLKMNEGNSPAGLEVVKTAWGKRLAFVFHNHSQELEQNEYLSLIDLDPNGDLDYQDAQVLKQIKVGSSKVEGHYGHHAITFDHAGRYAFWTEPGAGKIQAFSLKSLKPVESFSVSGVPTKVIAVGQQDRRD
ncbi:hypothetical protein [Gimesia fumaroli]|uniref:Uncharacterized protein n=1 Tax=Gimesia fumaroli TaxID=2527976 RepID=A0A518IC55_9PLAN|nr:hypothetical protein [Gimesia fumaroli]QDV50664.1 hypothetical protein Enr17x_27060 [Gimesia fumaroli]